MELTTIILIYGLIWLFTRFEPIQSAIDDNFIKLNRQILSAPLVTNLSINIQLIIKQILEYTYLLIGCQRCLTLWIFIWILPLLPALLITMAASIHQKIEE